MSERPTSAAEADPGGDIGWSMPASRARLALRSAFGLVLVLSLPLSCGSGAPVGGRPGTAGSAGGLAGASGTLGRGSGSSGGGTAPSGTAGAGGSAGAGSPSPGGSSGIDLQGAPLFTRVQRLTVPQWERAVADVLRFVTPVRLSQTSASPGALPEADFPNNERRLFVDQQAERDFEAGAEAAAALAAGTPEALARLYAGTDPPGFVSALGRRAFRRPLTPDEQASYQGIFAAGERLYGAGFANGAALVIRAMLQSPQFLYRSELGPAGQPLDGYEIASKLSFWLLGTTPGDELLDSAASGKLDSVDGLESAARAMLERPAAAEIMRDFHGQLYHLEVYDQLPRTALSPDLPPELAAASRRFFDEIFARGEGLRAILTSSRTFVGPLLAAAYGAAPPASTGIEERTLDASRIGYFMQIPFLLANGRDDGPDSIRRGNAVANQVLCLGLPEHVTPPPPLPTLAPGQTNRQRVEGVTAGCAGCHSDYVDPLGFAFEAFDGLGQARTLDNGVPLDTAGRYPFEDGARAFADARDLMRALADAPQAHRCYAKMLAGYALGRDIVASDLPWLEGLAAVSRERSLKEMVVSLVRAPAFRTRSEGPP